MKRNFVVSTVILLMTLTSISCSSSSKSTASKDATEPQRTFNSADEAVTAAVNALRSNDMKSLQAIFGPDADEVLSSGDETSDRQRISKFLAAYDEKHTLHSDENGDVTILVGNDDWPMPIPIVKGDDGLWAFDTEAGLDEMLSRRIGQNELDVIQVCQAIVDAQDEYAHRDPDKNGIEEYAPKFVSDPGKRNGLYWPAAEGEAPSPLGDLVAQAVEEGYEKKSGEPQPYHGYYYRMLDAQGPDAPGGAMDYVIKGRMIGGFAVVAFPAEYGNSGIQTFMVSQSGVVYQSDLGEDTMKIAKEMKVFNPDKVWKRVEEPAKP